MDALAIVYADTPSAQVDRPGAWGADGRYYPFAGYDEAGRWWWGAPLG